MAEPIVRSFVIDTSESEQNLKELNVQISATSATINNASQSFNLNTKDSEQNLEALNAQVKDLGDELKQIPNDIPKDTIPEDLVPPEAIANTKSLKGQLRELQAQLAATEPDSAKYRELAAAAGELKDRIGDAAEAVGTQAGGAFERVSGSLGLVTSRIANLDFEGAAEGAKLLAQNITQIKPGDIAKGIQGIGSAFASVGKALLTNPIFLVGAAIAAAIVYADELLSLIDGVTDAETKALDVQKERAATAKEQADFIASQEEQLKLQGKTEKEITALKVQALDAAILEQQAVVETTRIQAEGQIKAAERNAEYLKTFLDFVTFPQRKLAEFFEGFVNGSIDILNKLGLGIEKINVSGVFEDVNNFIVKQVFDPEAERKNQEQIVKDAEKSLNQLNEQRAKIINDQNEEDAKAAGDAAEQKAKAAKDAADAQLKAEQEVSDLLNQLYEENVKEFEDAEKAKTQAALDEANKRLAAANNYYNKLAELQDSEFEGTLSASEKEELAVTQKYEDLFAAADAYNATLKEGEEGKAIDTTELQKKLALELGAIQQKSAEDANAAIEGSTNSTLENIQKGLEWAEKGLNAISALNDAVFANKMSKVKKGSKEEEALAKKQFKFQKALQLGAATIDAAKSVTASLASAPVAIGPVPNPAGIASLALATTTGVASIAKIAATKFEGGGSGGLDSTTPSIGGGGDVGGGAQPAQFNPLESLFLQERPEQLTPRAYVLAGDVASAAEVRENVADLARIG
jgi:hypothetical protein